jgi:RNA polymerase sigma-70 factor (ECF subfamily)
MRLRTAEDSVAWNRFVQLYTPLLHFWVTRLGIDPAQRMDVCQEVLVVLIQSREWLEARQPIRFRAWLYTVTANKCRDLQRGLRRVTEPEWRADLDPSIPAPQDELDEQEYRAYLARAALRLMRDCFSESTWRACWEHVAEGRSAADVARELGISENAVYLARGRVLKRLRQELDGLWE